MIQDPALDGKDLEPMAAREGVGAGTGAGTGTGGGRHYGGGGDLSPAPENK